ALSNDEVIALLNSHFVPVYICNHDYGMSGSAPEEEKAELRRLRAEAAAAQFPDRRNQVWILSPQGHPLDTLETGQAARSKPFLAYLERHLPDSRSAGRPPLNAPAPQSRRPHAEPDAVVLHQTARYLERQGDDYLPEKMELGRSD